MPDMVSWLNDVYAVLKPGGILLLAIPDKRFTFDINRIVITPSEIIGAYYDELSSFTLAMMCDFVAEYIEDVDSLEVWEDKKDYTRGCRRWTHGEAIDMCLANLNGVYVDCHCYVLMPKSFAEILKKS